MTTSNKLTKKELNQVFWRSFGLEWSWNYERQMNMSYCYSMLPVIKKLYPNKASLGILQYNSTIGNINLRY